MVSGNPRWYKMSQMKSTTRSALGVVTGLYSIHFVRGPIMSSSQHENGHEGGIVIKLWAGTFIYLPKNWHLVHCRTSSSASLSVVG